MKHHTIAVIPGDGIGEEVAPEGVKVLDVAGELTGSINLHMNISRTDAIIISSTAG